MTRAETIRHLQTGATLLDNVRGLTPRGEPILLPALSYTTALLLASAMEEAAERLAGIAEWENDHD